LVGSRVLTGGGLLRYRQSVAPPFGLISGFTPGPVAASGTPFSSHAAWRAFWAALSGAQPTPEYDRWIPGLNRVC